MKNLKKVLALALAFVMCFTMFAGAAVYSDVPAGSDYSEAVTMLSDLGVIAGYPDGSFKPEKTVTRAEAAAFIARLMTGETTPTKYAGASNFVDVPANHFAESSIAYCVVNGIVVGVGNGKFAPDRAVTDGEFVAMVTRALGYDTAANPLSFPYGNIAVAQQEGVLDGVTIVPNSPALRGEDAQMIYNALFADYDRLAKAENIFEGADEHDEYTIAEEVFGLGKLHIEKGSKKEATFKATDSCVAHTWVVAGVDAREAKNTYIAYRIDDKGNKLVDETVEFTYEGDAESIVGYQVELWGDIDHTGDVKEVVAVKTVKGQTALVWNPSMELDGSKVVVDDEKLETKYAKVAELQTEEKEKLEGVFTQKSGKAYKLADVKKADLAEKNGTVYNVIDWDSDGKADFVVADEVAYAKVTSATNKRIGLEAENNNKITLELDNDLYKVEGADEIEKDDIVEIALVSREWKKGDDEIVTFSLTVVDPETKELTKVSTRNNAAYFDDEAIDEADAKIDWNTIVTDYEEVRGADYSLWMNRNGMIIKAEEGESDATGYLMVLDTGKGRTSTNYRKLAAIDVLYDNGEFEDDVQVASDLKVQDIDKDTIEGAYNKNDREFDERLVVGQAFKYYTDEDGTITKLVAATDTVDSSWDYVAKSDRLSVNNSRYALEDAKVIFLLAQNAIVEDKNDNDEGPVGTNVYVDEDNAGVLALEDLAELEDLKDQDFVGVNTDGTNWYGNGGIVAAAFAADKNDDISVAVLGVNEFATKTTEVALVTEVEYDKNDVVTIEAAMNGEVTTFSSVEDKDLDDVMVEFPGEDDVDEINEFLNNGKYAEVKFDKEGNVVKVDFMEDKGAYLEGEKFIVRRVVVGNTVKEEHFSIMDNDVDVRFYDKKTFYEIDNKSDLYGFDTDEDTFFYTIEGRPTVENEVYEGAKLQISNGFADKAKVDNTKNLSNTINDNYDWDGDYVVVDVVYSVYDKAAFNTKYIDAEAVYAFEDVMYEKDGSYVAKDSVIVEQSATKGAEKDSYQPVIEFSGKFTGGTATFTIDGTPIKLNLENKPMDAASIADAVAAQLVGSGWYADGATLKHNTAVDTLEAANHEVSFSADFGITVKSVPVKTAKASAVLTIKVVDDLRAGLKVVLESAFDLGTTKGADLVGGNYTLNGAMSKTDIAKAIEDYLDNYEEDLNWKVERDGATVTVTTDAGDFDNVVKEFKSTTK